jgi:hypothetical protein
MVILHKNIHRSQNSYLTLQKMFTKGQLIFTLFFLVVFIVGMVWSYKKDAFLNKLHFKGASKTLLVIGILLIALFLFVKMSHLH